MGWRAGAGLVGLWPAPLAPMKMKDLAGGRRLCCASLSRYSAPTPMKEEGLGTPPRAPAQGLRPFEPCLALARFHEFQVLRQGHVGLP
jgi:hypothetical protein